MTKRSNDKLSPQRLEQLRELLLRPETVALMAGLDFSRDIGIRWVTTPAPVQAWCQKSPIWPAAYLPWILP